MLTLCPKCSQFHGRAEKRCPFCGARRAVTAALVGAALALGAGSCKAGADAGSSPKKTTTDSPARVIPVPPYGVPTPDVRLEPPPTDAGSSDAAKAKGAKR
jgi:hypothetical protein